MISILCLHIAEKQASYRYRVEQFLPYWKEYGIEMHTVQVVGKNYIEKISLMLECGKYDYVWLQRKPLTPLFTRLVTRSSRLIYDYDDALYTVESSRKKRPKPTQPGSKQTIRRINSVLGKASLVFAGSAALAEYARQFNPENTFIVPTAYEKVADPPGSFTTGDTVTIGWIGNVGNLFFLSGIDAATAALQNRFPKTRFSLMSGKAPEGLKTRWELVPWSKEAEDAWLRSIDIGIMPLVDDAWSRGKCAFKLLQYMAYGKPVVASAVGANFQAVKNGISGFLAATPAEWEKYLTTLVSEPQLRKSMGEESLNHFLSTYERQQVQEQMASLIHRHFRQTATET